MEKISDYQSVYRTALCGFAEIHPSPERLLHLKLVCLKAARELRAALWRQELRPQARILAEKFEELEGAISLAEERKVSYVQLCSSLVKQHPFRTHNWFVSDVHGSGNCFEPRNQSDEAQIKSCETWLTNRGFRQLSDDPTSADYWLYLRSGIAVR